MEDVTNRTFSVLANFTHDELKRNHCEVSSRAGCEEPLKPSINGLTFEFEINSLRAAVGYVAGCGV